MPAIVFFLMLLCAKHYATKAGKKKARLYVGSIFCDMDQLLECATPPVDASQTLVDTIPHSKCHIVKVFIMGGVHPCFIDALAETRPA